jgi:murein peptide amidase A
MTALSRRGGLLTSFILGNSPQGLPIFAYRFGGSGPRVFILGGVHGDETEGVVAAFGLLESFLQSFTYQVQLVLVPVFNVDGVLAKTRTNSRGVDLNRNLPTKDWSAESTGPRYHPGPRALSEPENKGLVQFIEKEKPQLIITLHSWHPTINVNGDCLAEAKTLSRFTGYKVVNDIGYPTPGCLGTYAGKERSSPVITYEIERGLSAEKVLQIHVPALLEALKTAEVRHV